MNYYQWYWRLEFVGVPQRQSKHILSNKCSRETDKRWGSWVGCHTSSHPHIGSTRVARFEAKSWWWISVIYIYIYIYIYISLLAWKLCAWWWVVDDLLSNFDGLWLTQRSCQLGNSALQMTTSPAFSRGGEPGLHQARTQLITSSPVSRMCSSLNRMWPYLPT